MRFDERLSKPVTVCVFAAACAFAPLATPSPQPAPPPANSPLPASSLSPTAAPSPTESPYASPSPAPTPTILILPPDAAPQILWYQLSSSTPHAGDVVTGIVLTSSNVASVEIRVGGYSINLPKIDVGHFEGSYRVPSLPFFMSHRLTMVIIARNTAGVEAQTITAMQIL